jgi:hypothetical protein
MANKGNFTPGTPEREDPIKPKGTGDVGQSGTVGSEGGGTGPNRGLGSDNLGRDRDLEEEEPGSLDRNRGKGTGGQGDRNR